MAGFNTSSTHHAVANRSAATLEILQSSNHGRTLGRVLSIVLILIYRCSCERGDGIKHLQSYCAGVFATSIAAWPLQAMPATSCRLERNFSRSGLYSLRCAAGMLVMAVTWVCTRRSDAVVPGLLPQ
jgi:hypothetical protein